LKNRGFAGLSQLMDHDHRPRGDFEHSSDGTSGKLT
jgi:hypothetical protein